MDESENSCKKFDIFIIEDDEGTGRLMQKELNRHGYEVSLAGTGKQALTLINGTKKEILLVDYKLPDMSGMQLIQKLQEKYGYSPNFVTLTGFGNEKIAVEMMKMGSRDYIVKDPEFLEILPRVLKRICKELNNEIKLEETELHLKKNLGLLKETGEMAKVGGWEIDLDTQKVYWTDTTIKIHEVSDDYTPDLSTAIDFYPKGARHKIEKAVERAIEKGEKYSLELPFITAKGKNLWVATQGNPKMENGKCVQLKGTIQDITQRKKAERELKKKTAILKRTEQIAHVGSWNWEIATDKVTWSEELFHIFRRNPKLGAVSYAEHPGVYSADSMKMLDEAVRKCIETGESYELDVEIMRGDGKTAFCTTQGFARKNDSGKVIQIYGSFQDITERKKKEEHLKQLNKELSKNERKNRELAFELGERLKEMRSLYSISSVIEKPGISLEEILQESVQFISSGFQFPGKTYVRIIYKNKEFKTVPFRETRIKISQPLLTKMPEQGTVEVFMNDDEQGGKTPSFLNEEKELLFLVADRLGKVTDRYETNRQLIANEQQLKASNQQLEAFNQQLISGEQQLQAANQQLAANEQQLRAANQQLVANEQELIRARKIAEKNEERYRKSQEIGHIGSWEYNLEKEEFWGSDESKRIYNLNLDRKDFPVDEVMKIVAEKDRGKVNQAMIDLINDNKPYDIEFEITPKNTSEKKIIRSIAELQTDESGKPLKVTGVLHDITLQKTTEAQLIHAKEKAEESDKLKSAFLANMSHEIRTPMNGILGFTDLLKNPELSGEQQQKFIEIIHKSGNRMLETVNAIIDISQIETGQADVKTDTVDIRDEIESLFTFFDQEAEQKGLMLSIESIPSEKSYCITDRYKFNSVFTNLIKNAIKYTKEGSIKIGCEIRNNQLFCYVKDTGIGVPEDRQSAIFNRFEQADIGDTEAFEGSGLGLAIAKAYVEMLGGEIGVESQKGKGSEFWFTLPEQSKTPQKEKSEYGSDILENNTFRKLKIIVAEDDEASAEFLAVLLKKRASEILVATSGKETVEFCRKHSDADLILMDIKMPEGNGYDSLKEIRKFNDKIKIIAQTANALTGDRAKILTAGFDEYVSKPIKKNDLMAKIEKLFVSS